MDLSLAGSQSVFVLELVSSGYFGDNIGPSFHAEGRAMLDAVLRDFHRLAGIRVVTPQASEGRPGLLLDAVARHSCDAALIIAPEFDGLLEQFCAAARADDCRPLNCEPSTIRLCSDKWRLHQHLVAHDITTVPTRLLPLGETPPEFPCVVKPRDGAGSWLVRRVYDSASWQDATTDFAAADRTEFLCQPLIAGMACSVAAVFAPDGRHELLPIAEQCLSDEGEFRYLGGRIPARLSHDSALAVQKLIASCLHTLSGCRGYVGCDVVIPHDRPAEPVLVEINPRLTTSYIGYQRLCRDNLMERLLSVRRRRASLHWHDGAVEFDPHGRCEFRPS